MTQVVNLWADFQNQLCSYIYRVMQQKSYLISINNTWFNHSFGPESQELPFNKKKSIPAETSQLLPYFYFQFQHSSTQIVICPLFWFIFLWRNPWEGCRSRISQSYLVDRNKQYGHQRKEASATPLLGLLHPPGSLVSSYCFWAHQSILTGFYNGDLWEILFGSIDK